MKRIMFEMSTDLFFEMIGLKDFDASIDLVTIDNFHKNVMNIHVSGKDERIPEEDKVDGGIHDYKLVKIIASRTIIETKIERIGE